MIIRYAWDVFANHPKEWRMMMKRCMKADHSWRCSAGKYEELYQGLLG